jgi:hypothetical protein
VGEAQDDTVQCERQSPLTPVFLGHCEVPRPFTIFTSGHRYVGSHAPQTCYWHQMKYCVARSVTEKDRHLVFMETGFDRLPDSIQRQGPWQLLTTGEFEHLRSEYQKALSKRGFIIVEQSPHVFNVERPWPFARPSHQIRSR